METTTFNFDVNTGTIEYLEQRYLFVSPTSKLSIDKSLDYDCIIIDGKNIDFVKMIVKKIRKNNNPMIYLKPIVLLNGNAHKDPFINNLIDGVIYSFDQIKLIYISISEIIELINNLDFISSISFESMLISKLLYYMYTRNIKTLEPIPYIFSNTNYCYPILSVNFKYSEENKVFELIKIAEDEGLFKSKFIDLSYSCSNCKSTHLSYRETCPRCGNSHTDTFDIVHHFPCAYVGPITDFTNEIDDQLSCPKCSKSLKHIGVDYDKPSVLHICKNCENKFQDYNVKAKCMYCNQDNLVENLSSQEIREYTLTQKGENYSIQGYVSTPKDIEEIIGTVKYDTFRTIVKYEIERIKQSEGASNIVSITINNAGQFYSKVGSSRQQTLLKDLVREIRSSIRSSDMISFYSSSVILITMFEIPDRIAVRIMNEIVTALKKLVENNFNDLEIQLKPHVHLLNTKLSAELQINQLISE